MQVLEMVGAMVLIITTLVVLWVSFAWAVSFAMEMEISELKDRIYELSCKEETGAEKPVRTPESGGSVFSLGDLVYVYDWVQQCRQSGVVTERHSDHSYSVTITSFPLSGIDGVSNRVFAERLRKRE